MIPSSTVLSKTDYEEKLAHEAKQRDFSLSFREYIDDGDYYYTLRSSEVTATKPRIIEEEAPFILIPQVAESPKIHKFETELEYEGFVISVNSKEKSFTARIIDVKSNNEEEGEFSLDELNGDQSLVMPGAVFTWIVGLQFRGKNIQRVSDIRFRRHAALPAEMISRAESKAKELSEFLSGCDSYEPITLVID